MSRPYRQLPSIVAAFLMAAGVTSAQGDDAPLQSSPRLSYTLSDLGHLEFGRVIPFDDDPRFLMWWPSENKAMFFETDAGRIRPVSEHIPLEAYRVLQVDSSRLVMELWGRQRRIAVHDTESLELIDVAESCSRVLGWADENVWVGIDHSELLAKLVVRDTHRHVDFRVGDPRWKCFDESLPLFVDAEPEAVTVGFQLVPREGEEPADDVIYVSESKLCVCRIDLTSQEIDWSHELILPSSRCQCVSEGDPSRPDAEPTTPVRLLATTDGIFRMTYDASGIELAEVLGTELQYGVVYDRTRSAFWNRQFDHHTQTSRMVCISWPNGVVEVRPTMGFLDVFGPKEILVGAVHIVWSDYDMHVLVDDEYEYRWQEHRALGPVQSSEFTEAGDRLVLSGERDSMVFEIDGDSLRSTATLTGLPIVRFRDEETIVGIKQYDGTGVFTPFEIMELTPQGTLSRSFVNPEYADQALFDFPTDQQAMFPTLSSDGQHVLFIDEGFMFDERGLARIDIPASDLGWECADALSGGNFLLVDDLLYSKEFQIVDVQKHSVREVVPRLQGDDLLTHVRLLDSNTIMAFLLEATSPPEIATIDLLTDQLGITLAGGSSRQLVTVDVDGNVTPVGDSAWRFEELRVHTTGDRRYLAIMTVDGLVRLDTQTWEHETFQVPGLTDYRWHSVAPLPWQLTPQGDGVAWVKDATLYFTRLTPHE